MFVVPRAYMYHNTTTKVKFGVMLLRWMLTSTCKGGREGKFERENFNLVCHW